MSNTGATGPDPGDTNSTSQAATGTATAAAVIYDNTTSGLAATDAQSALDEIVTRIVALETP
jgi:hypothetical protein